MNATNEAKVMHALRVHRPAVVRVVNPQGERAEVAIRVTAKGPRLKHALQVLDGLDWVKLELLDAKGRLLAIVDNDASGPATEIEDVSGSPQQRELAGIVSLVIRAQDVAMARLVELIKPVMTAMEAVLRNASDQATTYRREAVQQVRAQSDLLGQMAELAERYQAMQTAGNESTELQQIMGLLPVLSSLGGGGGVQGAAAPRVASRPAVKPNGARPAAAPPTPPAPASAPPPAEG